LLRRCVASSVLLITAAVARADVAVIPRPTALVVRKGKPVVLSPRSIIVADPDALADAMRLASALAPAMGGTPRQATARRLGQVRSRLRLCPGAAGRCRTWVRLTRAGAKRLPDEGYRLEVAGGGVTIRARTSAGWFYGIQTLLELLPPAIFSPAPVNDVSWAIDRVRIDDAPRFAWRGLHLDVARHFQALAVLLRLVDQMALHKLNRLHLHLSDDQGWRIEISPWPLLTQVGSFRAGTRIRLLPDGAFLNALVDGYVLGTDPGLDGVPYGGFYTQDELRTLVEYAAVRHIEIVPEIDMPGHTQAAVASYPEFGSTTDPVSVSGVWGPHPHVLNPGDATLAFVADVIDELDRIFPGRYVHVGGDEVVLTEWDTDPTAQARIAALGLANTRALRDWFVGRTTTLVTSSGRRPIVWNDALSPELAPDVVVMAWLGGTGGRDAIAVGHDVVMAPLDRTYFDHAQGPLPPAQQAILDSAFGPHAGIVAAFTTDIAEVYGFDPTADLTATEATHVVGGQAQLWSEYIDDRHDLDRQAFPRAAALAEVLWTRTDRRDLADFQTRLATHLARLDQLGVEYYRAP